MKKRNKRDMNMYPFYFSIPSILIFGIFFVLPVVASFFLSFTDWHLNRFLTPGFNGLENFRYLFNDKNLILSLKNTLIFAVCTVVLKTSIGFFAALLLVKNFPLRNAVRTIFILPCVLSMVVVGILFIALFRMDGVINNLLGALGLYSRMDWLGNRNTALYISILADVWRWSGYCMAIFVAGIQGISQDYFEAAEIDGANGRQIVRYITLPLLIPALSVNITFNLIGGLKVFEQVYVVTKGGPGYASQVLSTYIFKTFGKGQLGRSTAMGLMLFVIVLAASQITEHFLKKAEVEY